MGYSAIGCGCRCPKAVNCWKPRVLKPARKHLKIWVKPFPKVSLPRPLSTSGLLTLRYKLPMKMKSPYKMLIQNREDLKTSTTHSKSTAKHIPNFSCPPIMNSYSDVGIVLKRLNLGRSRQTGNLVRSATVRLLLSPWGCAGPISKRAGSLELFNMVEILFHQGQGRTGRLGRSADPGKPFRVAEAPRPGQSGISTGKWWTNSPQTTSPTPKSLKFSKKKSFPNWWFWIRLGIKKIKNSKLKFSLELGCGPKPRNSLGK